MLCVWLCWGRYILDGKVCRVLQEVFVFFVRFQEGNFDNGSNSSENI